MEKKSSASGVRTHADIRPLELKSNALTTRPSHFDNIQLENEYTIIHESQSVISVFS